jgi:PiT family inorganic phosphate transporter
MALIFVVIIVALAFEYINGFHDTANAIATSVSTRVMTPRQAITVATIGNLFGALAFTAVAKTIGKDLVNTHFITPNTLMCALLGAIIWNLLTWWIALPSSSSHALIGGLCGAALASAHGNWDVIYWHTYDPIKHVHGGLWPKVVAPMMIAPVAGLLIAFIVMGILLFFLRSARPVPVNRTFKTLQWFSSAWMSFSHGTNDAQKTMGVIALTLFTASKAGAFKDLPEWLKFLHTPTFEIATWIKVACALTMAAGTAAGGWRIIRTMGHHLVRMQTIHGCVAQSTAAAVIEGATHWGIPLSTTHVISGSVMGVGATKRLNAVKWGIAGRMVWAWVLTIPICATLAYLFVRTLHLFGAA